MKAFPQKYPIDASEPHHWVDNPLDRGMDLRDYFAAKAMQALVATFKFNGNQITEVLPINAYQIADAMLEARK